MAGWLLVDPETMLITGVREEGVPREEHLALIERELTEPGLNKFAALAQAEVPAASLSAGHACLTRWAGEPWFSAAEVDQVARPSPHIGHGIHTALLLAETARASAEGPALVVLDDESAVVSATPQALDWLGPVDDPHPATTIVLHEVAQQARALAEQGGTSPCQPPDIPGETRTVDVADEAQPGQHLAPRGVARHTPLVQHVQMPDEPVQAGAVAGRAGTDHEHVRTRYGVGLR